MQKSRESTPTNAFYRVYFVTSATVKYGIYNDKYIRQQQNQNR